MVAALIPLAAAVLPSIINAFKGPPPAPAATPAPAAAPSMVNDPRLTPAIQPMPAYALTPSGQMVQLPAEQQAALMRLAQAQGQAPLEQHAALVGRAEVRRVQQQLSPQLEHIRQQLDHQALQTQATAEHRRIEDRKAFQRSVLQRLNGIERAARISRY
jgi:hypothetical protein